VVIVEGEWAVSGVNLGRPILTNGAFATRSSQITLRLVNIIIIIIITFLILSICLQCFDAVGWVAGRASGL